MVIVKRYPNRKLYDTNEKQYVTLEGIADLIREGNEVQVVDHATGEDLTTLTLTQIIFEQEKKQSGFLPRSVLTSLVKAGGDTVGTLRRALASPLDIIHQVDEEIESRVDGLVRRGELAEEEGRSLVEKLMAGQPLQRVIFTPDEIEQKLRERGVPTQTDIQKLSQEIDALNAALSSLDSEEADL